MDINEISNLIISGIIDQENVTLYKSKMTKTNHEIIYGVSNIIIHIDFALFGFDYKNKEEIMLSSMKLSIEGLREWLFMSGVSTQHDNESRNYTINSEPLSSISIGNYENFDLKISFGRNFNRSRFDVSITQEAYFSLTSEKLRPLDNFLDMIYKIRSFLCFAIDRMVSIKSIISYSTDKLMKIQNDDIPRPIKIYYKSFPSSNEIINIHRYGMFFSYFDIQDRFSNVMKKWIESYNKIESVFNLYFTSLSMFNTYSPERFLLLVRGIEVFHRKVSEIDGKKYPSSKFQNMKNCILSKFPESSEMRLLLEERLMFANEISLRQRITKMIQPFKDLYGLNTQQEIDSFVGSIVNTRNYFTHYGRKPQNTIDKGQDVYKLCIKMEALLQLCFLKLIGMDVESIETIVSKNHHLRHKLDLD